MKIGVNMDVCGGRRVSRMEDCSGGGQPFQKELVEGSDKYIVY